MTDIDLIFTRVKDKTERKIDFTQFKEALNICAGKRGQAYEALENIICNSGGKKLQGTKFVTKKLFENKDMFNGAHSHSVGPTTRDTDNTIDVGDLMANCDGNTRVVKKQILFRKTMK